MIGTSFRAALVAAALAATAGAAQAGTKTLATGAMYYGAVLVDTTCLVTNVGKKPVTITAARVRSGAGSTGAPVDNCTTGPLQPDGYCAWSGPGDVYGGGEIDVQGSTKGLRGHCDLRDGSGLLLMTLELR